MSAQQGGAKPVVLVIEDEPILRIFATDWIEEAGFEVVDVHDAASALKVLEARTDIRLVFADIDLPRGMTGLHLVALVRRRWPPIALVVTSGIFKPSYQELPAGSRFFGKPYRVDEVAKTMHELVN